MNQQSLKRLDYYLGEEEEAKRPLSKPLLDESVKEDYQHSATDVETELEKE